MWRCVIIKINKEIHHLWIVNQKDIFQANVQESNNYSLKKIAGPSGILLSCPTDNLQQIFVKYSVTSENDGNLYDSLYNFTFSYHNVSASRTFFFCRLCKDNAPTSNHTATLHW